MRRISCFLYVCSLWVAVSSAGVLHESPKSILSRRLKANKLDTAFIPRGGSTYARGGSTEDNDDADNADAAEVTTLLSPSEDDADDSTEAVSEADDAAQLLDNSVDDIILQEATALRQQGKELHDAGDWWEAAKVFSQAADLVQEEPEHLTDYCTCRLHEALCQLKMEDYDACLAVCTGILDLPDLTGAIRARAYHRRAKAHVGLENAEEALVDARAAAFLGDRKAVALYGKLMRGNSGTLDELASPPMLNDLLQGKNPFLSSSAPESSSSSNPMLLESLLGKSGLGGDIPSLLGQGGAGGTLAKSLLSSLTKRLETDSDSICAYLQKTNPSQLQQLGSLAGVPLSENQATRLVKFCHSVTPKAIRRTVKFGKRGWYGLTLIRKSIKVVNKYKHLLILWVLALWIKSAILRPIPISKKAQKAAKLIAAATAAK
jgi:tetratricopeptide (TPR) repeat protein